MTIETKIKHRKDHKKNRGSVSCVTRSSGLIYVI